ncbi:NADH dehydrogenase [ubiquinone] 1 alpha subcomplex subunit 6-like [Pollicipes pollicipes]|uniref:NADH dehydrogenase [ubiquinone] 1 alpha subcomplex subunit 6-like n=1 Tax=Pollicipes pollicipes TaxID=41117 RepID=UPI001884DC49|nr:NADH dehydrogenase [ubiquinone] 1 alpha subcomplex subunit 6-like [Pollicipes pollicipes]XP_037074530.1 NADH dehydrogenase [ubiquinone] 1 alpha subcomplex subunit 6-like [Pollicipes pollicipes]XP_037075622.1 NADH dehydrogenase [ubiquinone] 1 alpha subcomplex subunit 6-like [Pollicipes pollicipes]XP_037076612.1 NADH dehydrogenase [ubiquinone] 1 alpha subcomplex subunit 6-like [Pollicipes pollicipes]
MASRAVQSSVRHVKPLISHNREEAKSRVFGLYKAWYRQMPYIVMDYDIPKSVEQCRAKLREKFEQNRHVKDIRVIDALVVKGQQELKETVNIWKQKHHLMSYYFKESQDPKPKDFLSKFLSGH